MSGQFYMYSQEIRHNYKKLVDAYNTLKIKTGKRICALEGELHKSRELVENLNNRLCTELQELRRQLFELEEKMERNKQLYEKKIDQILSTEVCTCSRQSLSVEKTNCDEIYADINLSIVDTTPCVSVTCESCIFHKTQLDELNNKICDLMDEIRERTETLHGSEQLNQTFSRKLDEKDRDLNTLAHQLNRKVVKCSRLGSKLQTVNERNNILEITNTELLSANTELSDKNTELSTQNTVLSIKNTELLSRLYDVEEELSNVQSQLNTKLNEIEFTKNLEIQEYIKTGQELKKRLISQGEQLKTSEESKNTFEEIYNDLTIKYNELQNMLNKRNKENAILDKIVKKLKDLCSVTNGKVIYLRTNLKICAANLKSSIEENNNLKSELECVRYKFENNKKILRDVEFRLNESNEKNRNLMSKIEVDCEKLNCYEKIIHETELNRNKESLENNNRKLELETVTNESKRLIDINNLLCKRIADLAFSLANKCQADVTNVSNSKTAFCLCARTSSNNCSCSTGSNGKATIQLYAHTSSDDNNRSNGFIVSKYHDFNTENEILKRHLSENFETIRSIQRKAEDTENELKERCDKMAHMLVEAQEIVVKNQINALNKTAIKKMKVDNIITDKTVKENPQTQTKQTTIVTDAITPLGGHEIISTYGQNVVIQKCNETNKLYDESSGKKIERNEKNKLIEDLARQLEMGIRKNRDVFNNVNHNLNRPETLRKRYRLSGKM